MRDTRTGCPERELEAPVDALGVADCAQCGEIVYAGEKCVSFGSICIHEGCESDFLQSRVCNKIRKDYLVTHFAALLQYVWGELAQAEKTTVYAQGWNALDARQDFELCFLEQEADFYSFVRDVLCECGGTQGDNCAKDCRANVRAAVHEGTLPGCS